MRAYMMCLLEVVQLSSGGLTICRDIIIDCIPVQSSIPDALAGNSMNISSSKSVSSPDKYVLIS